MAPASVATTTTHRCQPLGSDAGYPLVVLRSQMVWPVIASKICWQQGRDVCAEGVQDDNWSGPVYFRFDRPSPRMPLLVPNSRSQEPADRGRAATPPAVRRVRSAGG